MQKKCFKKSCMKKFILLKKNRFTPRNVVKVTAIHGVTEWNREDNKITGFNETNRTDWH